MFQPYYQPSMQIPQSQQPAVHVQQQPFQSGIISQQRQSMQQQQSQSQTAQQQHQYAPALFNQQQLHYSQFPQQNCYVSVIPYQTQGITQSMYVTAPPTAETQAVNANTGSAPVILSTSVDNATYANYPHQMLAAWGQNCQPSLFYQPIFTMTGAYELRNNNLLKQIESYLSPDNLKKDECLREKMDALGYIPLIVIVALPRVQQITNDILLVTRVLHRSSELELSPDNLKVRPRID